MKRRASDSTVLLVLVQYLTDIFCFVAPLTLFRSPPLCGPDNESGGIAAGCPEVAAVDVLERPWDALRRRR